MRNLFLYVFLLISSVGAAQTGISYQLLVYDSKQLPGNDFGQIKIRNRNVDIRFSVLDRNMQVEYQEESTYTTDNMGYVNAVIGSSQQISGYSYGFESITWEDFPKFLRVEIDINQNNQFILISEQSFTFSPYSFYSINSYKSEVKNGPQGPAGSGTDSQTIEVSLSGNVLRLLPENTTVTKTVDLSSLGGSGTDSQTIEVSLSGNVLRLLPENTTVTKTVDLSSLGGSGTDSQTIEVSLSGNVLRLLPENTTVTKTVDLSSLGGSGTDSQTIEVSLSGNVLRLLPENTTVTKTVDLSSLGGSGTDSQTIEVSLSGNVLRLLPENTTVTKTVDLSSLGGSGTDSQTIEVSLSGNVLRLLPENTTVTKTVDLSSLGGSGTDSQTIAATLSGTILQLLPENTTVSATVDLSSIDLVGDILAFSSISSIIAITTTSTLYTVPAGSSAEITAALPNVPLVSSNRIDYKPSDRSGFNNSWQAEFSIFVNGTEIYLGHSMRYDTSSGGTDAHPESGYINARLLQSRIILPEGSTIRLGDNLGYMSVIEYPKEKIDAKLITSLQTVPVGKTWKIVGILNSGSLGGYSTPASTENWSIDINGQELYLQGLRGQGTSDSDINWQSTKFLLEANVFLPSGITLEPNGSVFGIMVLEF